MLAFAAFLELANAVVVAWCPRTLIFCSFVFTHLTSPLNFFQCLDVVGSKWIPDRAGILKHRSHECFVCCVFESLICGFDVSSEEVQGLVGFIANIGDQR